MQLTSQGQSRAMVVEFQPHAILTDKFVYTLKFLGDEQTKSMRLMSKKEMIETVNARLDLNYQVTDFLTEPQEYFPAACQFMCSLIKQSIHPRTMQFQVTAIEFDFDEDDDFPEHQFSNITDETIGMIWEADDEEDLIEEITCATGWCIKSIDYRIILN